MNPEPYAELLNQTFTAFQSSPSLPDNFCTYVKFIETIPTDTITPEILAQVKDYFYDVNERIKQYDEQYHVLVQELGVLCSEESKSTIPERFFRTLLDFLRLAYSVYEKEPSKLQVFTPILKSLHDLFQTKTFKLEGELLQKALLLQLTKSSWILSKQTQPIETIAKQMGGSLKNKTRKQKQKQKQKQT